MIKQNQQLFQRLQYIELGATFGVPSLVLFIAFIVIGAAVSPHISALFPDWILLAWVPWWSSWFIVNAIIDGLGLRWLSRYYQRKLITTESVAASMPIQHYQPRLASEQPLNHYSVRSETEPEPNVVVVDSSMATR